jgi:hypothetical protein
MLGDVSHNVVTSAFGWFEPAAVRAMYSEGSAVAGSTEAAARMAEAHSKWGRKHFADVEDLEDHVAVTEQLVDGIEGAAIPLFVGWRNAARCETMPGRAAQLMQMLREWRGGLHLVSTTAVGLSPLEAILTNEGEGQAKFFGWAEPFPDVESIRTKHDEAETMTDRLCAQALAQALDEPEFGAFEAAVGALRTATPDARRPPSAEKGANLEPARVKDRSSGGHKPSGGHRGESRYGPVVQLGVHAALSRRRSRVQIPSGPPPRSSLPVGGSR